jgi:hypothetical protein
MYVVYKMNVLEQLDSVLLRLLDIQTELSCMQTALVTTRLNATTPGGLVSSKIHPDLLTLFDNAEDVDAMLSDSAHYTMNKQGKKVFCDHE